MKKANILIIGLILLILILLLGCKNCKKHEGFTEVGRTSDARGLPTAFGTLTLYTIPTIIASLTTNLTSDNILTDKLVDISTDINNFINVKYIAFIDDANNTLKIAKNNTTTMPVIWSSELSNPLWMGTTVTFTQPDLKIGTQTIGSATGGTGAKLTTEGDLVITDASGVILWSLASNELKTAKEKLNAYYALSENSDRSAELLALQKKLSNFDKYVTAVGLTSDNSNSDKLKEAHALLVQARHQMNFDLAELNGAANSKVVLSQNGLNSSLYVNLMATTLVAGLFILIATR